MDCSSKKLAAIKNHDDHPCQEIAKNCIFMKYSSKKKNYMCSHKNRSLMYLHIYAVAYVMGVIDL